MLLFKLLSVSMTAWSGVAVQQKTNKAAQSLLPIDWLHIQKCGSSFGNTLLRWACFPNMTEDIVIPGGGKLAEIIKQDGCVSNFVVHPGLRPEWPIGDHFSLRSKERGGDEGLGHVVTFIREPVERTISHAFYFDSKFKGTLKEIDERARNDMERLVRYEDALLSTKGQGVFWMPCFQVGRIAGNCTDTAEACDRLSRFGFIGLTSLWDASICNFYSIFGRNQPSKLELKNIRKGVDPYPDYPILRSVFYNQNGSDPVRDWPDMVMYQCAMRQFAKQIRKSPQCVKLAKEEIAALPENGRARELLTNVLLKII